MTDVVLMSVAEADRITDEVKVSLGAHSRTGAVVLALLETADLGEAWRAKHYRSMARYITAEFGYSRSNAYAIIDQYESVRRAIAEPEVSGDRTVPTQAEAIAERQMRPDPKSGGKRSGGFQGPVEKVRRHVEEYQTWFEAIDPEYPIDRDFTRQLERLRDVIDSCSPCAAARVPRGQGKR